MDAKEAFEIVLEMANKSYSKSFGPTEKEKQALEIAEDYMTYWRGKDPATGCDYGIGG